MLNLLSNNKIIVALIFSVSCSLFIPTNHLLAAPTVGKDGGLTGNGGKGGKH